MHAQVWADLAKRGALIGAHDLLLAATALAASWSVVTRNARHFRRVPGLGVLAV